MQCTFTCIYLLPPFPL
uniref:Uncharacterized protein n=1 Tax=Anguilla anguilla TaxID=7936 RepID=A0A0E9S083_ANGAN